MVSDFTLACSSITNFCTLKVLKAYFMSLAILVAEFFAKYAWGEKYYKVALSLSSVVFCITKTFYYLPAIPVPFLPAYASAG